MQGFQYRLQLSALVRQAVFHLRRHHGKHFTMDQSVGFQFTQLLDQAALGDRPDTAPEFAEARRLVHEMIPDQAVPFAADLVHRLPVFCAWGTAGLADPGWRRV